MKNTIPMIIAVVLAAAAVFAVSRMIRPKNDGNEKQYILSLVNGVFERREELDGYISRYSHGWKLSRISRTALGVLRCAMYEILYMPDIPAAASINEAVELAKRFDDPETVSFVNGILGSFMKDCGPSEDRRNGEA